MELFPYQIEGIRWLRANRKALLTDDPGLGKSVQLIKASEGSARVIVCPAVVKGVWRTQLDTWDVPHNSEITHNKRVVGKITTLSGKGSFRWPEKNESIIINHDILPDKFERPPDDVTIIFDEAHFGKNVKSQRHTKAKAMASAVLRHNGFAWGASGTPLVSYPTDLWGTLAMLDLAQDTFGSFKDFVRYFRGYQTSWGLKWGAPQDCVPNLLKKTTFGRRKKDVLPQLPTKMYQTIEVHIPRLVETEEITEEMIEASPQSSVMATARAALALAKANSGEVQGLLDVFEAEGQVVAFSAHVEAVSALSARSGWGLITGAISAEERTLTIQRFRKGELKGLAGTIGAMGVGVTLVEANKVIFLDRTWTPAENEQAEDRLCRIGQKNTVHVVDFVSDNKVDRAVFKILKKKKAIIEASIEESRK